MTEANDRYTGPLKMHPEQVLTDQYIVRRLHALTPEQFRGIRSAVDQVWHARNDV